MKVKKLFAALFAVGAMLAAGGAQAAVVSCGNSALGVRVTQIDPGLVGGFCYAQNGNFNGDSFTTAAINTAFITSGGTGTLDLRGKEITSVGDSATPLLNYTGTTSGTWTISNSLWTDYSRVFLAFHFGGGGNTIFDNPDSFIIELAFPDITGTWALTGTNAQLTSLSNIYVLSNGSCTATAPCVRDPQEVVPEPASLALVGLGLVAAVAARRRRRS